MASMLTFLGALGAWAYLDTEAAMFFLNGGAPEWARSLWWGCGAAVLVILWHADKLKGNIIGTIACVVFGPVTLLTLVYQWLSYKLFPTKEKQS